MLALPHVPHSPEIQALDPVLERLRCIMGCSRAARRLELFHACALLSTQPDCAFDAYAQALLRCLGREVGRPLIIYRTGAQERSFDEDWILRCLDRCTAGDGASLAFLIGRRVPKPSRRQVTFLIKGLEARSKTLHNDADASHRQRIFG